MEKKGLSYVNSLIRGAGGQIIVPEKGGDGRWYVNSSPFSHYRLNDQDGKCSLDHSPGMVRFAKKAL